MSYQYTYSEQSGSGAPSEYSSQSGVVRQYAAVGSSGDANVSQIASDLLTSYAAGGASAGGASYSSGSAGFAAGGAGYSTGGGAAYSAGGSASYSAGGSAAYSSGGSAAYSAAGSQRVGIASATGGSASVFLSEIEQAILRSTVPININETEEITVLGQRGIWANRMEVANWRGMMPISQYVINEDDNPEVITKRSQETLTYIQELAIRYLRPPTPPPPGEIVIIQQENTLTPPAPPVVIRQQPARPSTPEPLVIREAPPQPPPQVGRKVVTISGKNLPPPPRKVVIERLAPLPSKPQSVIIERWLPYSQVKRRVLFQKSAVADPVVLKPRNVIVQWEAPRVEVKKEIKYLGTVRANPAEYVQKYGASLKTAREMPDFVTEIKTPSGLVLAADYNYERIHELEGDLEAMRLIDLDREGLSEYRAQLERLRLTGGGSVSMVSMGGSTMTMGSSSGVIIGSASSSSAMSSIISSIFAEADRNGTGSIDLGEAERLLMRLNSRLGRNYGEAEARDFVRRLDRNGDGQLSLREFRTAFELIL